MQYVWADDSTQEQTLSPLTTGLEGLLSTYHKPSYAWWIFMRRWWDWALLWQKRSTDQNLKNCKVGLLDVLVTACFWCPVKPGTFSALMYCFRTCTERCIPGGWLMCHPAVQCSLSGPLTGDVNPLRWTRLWVHAASACFDPNPNYLFLSISFVNCWICCEVCGIKIVKLYLYLS